MNKKMVINIKQNGMKNNTKAPIQRQTESPVVT